MLALTAMWIALARQDPAAGLQQGLMDLKGGQYERARIELEEASHAQPRNAFVWVSLAEVYRRLKQPDYAGRAAVEAEKWGGAQPAIEHALAMFYAGNSEYGRAAKLEERYAATAGADPQALARVSGLYFQAGDKVNGERLYKSVWQKAKDNPAVAFQYAEMLLNNLSFSAAAEAVEPALAAHPENPQLILTMGVARYGQRRFEEARDEFLKVIAVDADIPQPYQFLGKMLEQAGPRLPEIRKAFEAWAARNPANGEAQLLLAKVRLSEDANNDSAEALLRRAVALQDSNWEAHYELGVVLEARRDFKDAADQLQRASELNAEQPMPHYHLARVYDRLGEPERAKAERQKHDELIAAGK